MLHVENISKHYVTGEVRHTALNGVTISFRKNEFAAILGPSGSGKTTFLNIVGGLDRADQGDLRINGSSTEKFSDSDWDAYRNNSVGFVFQTYHLIEHLNIRDNVMPASFKRQSLKAGERRPRMACEGGPMITFIKTQPTSGGQTAAAIKAANDPTSSRQTNPPVPWTPIPACRYWI